jgi:hypothetical protein
MNKILIMVLASAGTAFAALVSADARSVEVLPAGDETVASNQPSWRPVSSACHIEMRWKHDYSGQPYLRKVRICA